MKSIFIYSLLLLFIINNCYGLPSATLDIIPIEKTLTTDDFRNALERFRSNMRTGVGENNRILAPLLIDHSDTKFSLFGVFDLHGPINNVRIDGLDGFIINSLNYNQQTGRLDYSFTIPAMLARGIYDIIGTFGGLIPVLGNGNFLIAPMNLRFHGFAEFSPDQNNMVHLSDFYIRLSMDNLDTIISNLLFGGELGDLCNFIIQDITPATMNRRHSMISRDLRDRIVPMANYRLNQMTWNDFVNLIVPTADITIIQPIAPRPVE